jgi:hypothetical protein
MKLKISFRRQIQLLKSDLIGFLIGIIVLGIFTWNVNNGDITETSTVILLALTPLLLPLLVIHLNYFFINRNQTVIIDKDKNSIIICGSGLDRSFSFEDIKNISVFKGICYKNEKKKTKDVLTEVLNAPFRVPWSDYGYIQIIFKDREVVFLTALMIDLKEIPFDNYLTEYRVLPII